MNVLGAAPPPATEIASTLPFGFTLTNSVIVEGSGCMLICGEAFHWRPWVREGRKEGTIGAGGRGEDLMKGKLRNERGAWECDKGNWGLLDLVWPKPDLLILGTGPTMVPVSAATRRHISDLGIRLEVLDTRNAVAQFNLLATERGVREVAAALVPMGWKDSQ
ncbi:hypothetical protein K402DRAFT_389868 [Aulographum hederae CBS 113979]|uniref:NADH dehydrogenase [ubiquinone] 1 alpha subcomplex assembly factor 3 n=1 Tax=Aulographum hederae CBS 113979 TaxID=1176131 RepID=A0A6G1HB17_9PEZI|nr:hypothetical protein K402DRAFT_389868 [Aulographum hederae CBS 113979]